MMQERELNDFYNDGFGWICRQCEIELSRAEQKTGQPSRLFQEGEAESKTPTMSSPALAKWTDVSHRYLICPRCSITEAVELS